MLDNNTVTIWVDPSNELDFFKHLKIIDDLPIENSYTWNTREVTVSKAMISNWVWVNLSIELYLKFTFSFKSNGGVF